MRLNLEAERRGSGLNQAGIGGVCRPPGAIDGDVMPPMPGGGGRGRARSAEKVCHQVAGVGGGQDDALQQGFRFLRGIPGALVMQTRHNRKIPPIFRHFAALQVGHLSETSFRGDEAKVFTVTGL